MGKLLSLYIVTYFNLNIKGKPLKPSNYITLYLTVMFVFSCSLNLYKVTGQFPWSSLRETDRGISTEINVGEMGLFVCCVNCGQVPTNLVTNGGGIIYLKYAYPSFSLSIGGLLCFFLHSRSVQCSW